MKWCGETRAHGLRRLSLLPLCQLSTVTFHHRYIVKSQVTFHHLDVIHFSSNGWKALHFIGASQDANNSGRSRISWHIFLFSLQLIFSKLLHMSFDKYKIYMKIVILKNINNYSIRPFHLKSFCVKLPQINYRYIALQKLYFFK